MPFQHYLARAAGFEQVSPNKMVKNAIFTAFYGILRHKMTFDNVTVYNGFLAGSSTV